VELFNGPIVLPEGEVMICCNVAAMDAIGDLSIGNILETSLLDIWSGDKATRLRNSFLNGQLNDTCARCDMYRNLELYRTSEGRRRAALNRRRMDGEIVRREDVPAGSFSGG
jgi:radical SAM protein with 4Fe4S-binding SPASM domain